MKKILYDKYQSVNNDDNTEKEALNDILRKYTKVPDINITFSNDFDQYIKQSHRTEERINTDRSRYINDHYESNYLDEFIVNSKKNDIRENNSNKRYKSMKNPKKRSQVATKSKYRHIYEIIEKENERPSYYVKFSNMNLYMNKDLIDRLYLCPPSTSITLSYGESCIVGTLLVDYIRIEQEFNRLRSEYENSISEFINKYEEDYKKISDEKEKINDE